MEINFRKPKSESSFRFLRDDISDKQGKFLKALITLPPVEFIDQPYNSFRFRKKFTARIAALKVIERGKSRFIFPCLTACHTELEESGIYIIARSEIVDHCRAKIVCRFRLI